MKKLETNDWIILNNIIYKIYTTDNLDEMRRNLFDELKMIIDFDSADFYLASKEPGHLLCNPITYNCDLDLSEMYEDIDYSRGIVASGKMLIYRETDIISDETRIESEYYQKVYKPNNWHFALQMVLARHKKFLGAITFYRTIGKENFHYDDIFILDLLKDHLAYRLEQYDKNKEMGIVKYTVSEAINMFDLTKREGEILRFLIGGKDNIHICEQLVITENTLKKHILNLYRKLGINNRTQLFKMIKEFG
ncbi:MAG: helix-turn-helix transcriptional regulator [Pseudobutyrivibrio sp.]|nr:helix-turn-helix transcriptional regulator [Pseudobutyrivibrio sp.]